MAVILTPFLVLTLYLSPVNDTAVSFTNQSGIRRPLVVQVRWIVVLWATIMTLPQTPVLYIQSINHALCQPQCVFPFPCTLYLQSHHVNKMTNESNVSGLASFPGCCSDLVPKSMQTAILHFQLGRGQTAKSKLFQMSSKCSCLSKTTVQIHRGTRDKQAEVLWYLNSYVASIVLLHFTSLFPMNRRT